MRLRPADVVISADSHVTLLPVGSEPGEWLELAIFAVYTAGGASVYERMKNQEEFECTLDTKDTVLLGYDVTDDVLYSALLNIRGPNFDSDDLAREYAAGLNEFHLFREISDADKFRARADASVVDHAPFCVVAVRAVTKASSLD